MKHLFALLLLMASVSAHAASGFANEPNPNDFGVVVDSVTHSGGLSELMLSAPM